MIFDPIWKVLGFKSEEEYIENQAKNERIAHEKGFANYEEYKRDKDLKDAYKLDEGYDLYKDIDAIAEYAKTHDRPKNHKDHFYYSKNLHIKNLNGMPRRLGIYAIRSLNLFRLRPRVDEFYDSVFTISMDKLARDGTLKVVEGAIGQLIGEEARKKVKKERERLEKVPTPVTLEENEVYSVFGTLVDYLFVYWTNVNYFMDEPELKMEGTVFDNFLPEVDPNNIRKIEDLTQKDVVRLLRIVNSFRRKDIVDKFITDIGDVEDLYDLFYLFVGYVFQDYKNANYFLDEPELSSDQKYVPWQISLFGESSHEEYFDEAEQGD
jgi:hypothetical protein